MAFFVTDRGETG